MVNRCFIGAEAHSSVQVILVWRASVFSALFNEPKKLTKTTERQFLDTARGFELKLNVILLLYN